MKTQIVKFNCGGIDLDLQIGAGVFEPNLTTRILADVVPIPEGSRVLDLGCGTGPLAILAAKKGAAEVYAVDIMEEACQHARHNAELNGVADKVHVVQSHLFENLAGEKFDIIIDDVSGMAEDVSRISPWYPSTIPTGGYDGTGPTLEMLRQSRDHLHPNGQLYFPVLSLADHKKLITAARALFDNRLKSVAKKWIPFCDEFKEHMADMERMKREGVIDFVTKRSRHLWSLEIFLAVA